MRTAPLLGSFVVSLASLIPSLAAQAGPTVPPLELGPTETLQSYVARALARNPSLTPEELLRVKARFRLLAEDRVTGLRVELFMRPSLTRPTFRPPELPEFERESNDSIGYADPVTGSIKGDLSSDNDIDVYEFVMPQDGRIQLSVEANGASPVVDPLLFVTDEKRHGIFFNDDSGGTSYPAIDVPFPAGTYYVHVARFAGDHGTYQLNTGFAPLPFQTIAPGQTINDALMVAAQKGYTFTVPTDSKVNMTLDHGGSLDFFAVLLNARGATHQFIDDSSVGGLNPAFDTYLPAGTYHIIIGEIMGLLGSFSFTVDLIPMAIPPLNIGGTVTATAAGEETRPLYKLELAQAQQMHFQAAPAAVNPLPNPFFILYDRDLVEIFFQNNDRSSLYSNLQVPLPAGTYYLLWRSDDGNSGTLDVTTTSAPVPTPAATNLGRNFRISSPGPGTTLFELETRTPDLVEVKTLLGTMTDSTITVLDASGRAIASPDGDLSTDGSSLAGNLWPAGKIWILVRELRNRGGSYHLDVRPTIFYTDAVINRKQLNVAGKAGDWMGALVAALQETPNPIPVPFPLMGDILLDLSPSIFVGIAQIPPSGRFVWPFDFSPFPVVLQGLTVDSIPMLTTGRTTLVVR